MSKRNSIRIVLGVAVGLLSAQIALGQLAVRFDPFNPKSTLTTTTKTTTVTRTFFTGPIYVAPIYSGTIFVGPLLIDDAKTAPVPTEPTSAGSGGRPPVRDPLRPPTRSPFRP